MLLFVVVSAVSALHGEAGGHDEALLVFLHDNASPALHDFFRVITITGSAWFLFPLVAAIALVLQRHDYRYEAGLLFSSLVLAVSLAWLIKLVVGRSRPELWDTVTVYGSSFPSSHTLAVAACATAGVICARRMRPSLQNPVLPVAGLWIFLVGMSRLVLGVHWPSDVVISVCLGIVLPVIIHVIFERPVPE